MRDLVREGVSAETDVAVAAEVEPGLVLAHMCLTVLHQEVARERDAGLHVGTVCIDRHYAVRMQHRACPDVGCALAGGVAGHKIAAVRIGDALRNNERPRAGVRRRVPEAHRAAQQTNLVRGAAVEPQPAVLQHYVAGNDVDVAGIIRLVIVEEQCRGLAREREAVHVEPPA